MLDRETYQRLLDAHGRRIASRAAVDSTPEDQRDWTTFYACYGTERNLPENERSREGNHANAYRPAGWTTFYAFNPWGKAALSVMKDNNLADWWDASDAPTRSWMLSLAHKTDDELRTVAEELERRGDQVWADFAFSLSLGTRIRGRSRSKMRSKQPNFPLRS